jgi:hypothetical protein
LKKIIAVVVLTALIIATLAFLPLPSVKAAASEVRVLSYSYYTAPANPVLAQNQGDIVVVGEVQNVGSNIVQNVTLGGTALDSSGNTIASSSTGVVWSYEMAPGQKAPFFIDFTPQSSTTSSTNWMSSLAKFTITVLSVTDTTTSAYPNFHVPSAPSVLNESDVYTVVGTIVNNGTQTMEYVWVVTTFYNAAGTVVGLNYTYIVTPTAVLHPGGAARWIATPADDTAQLTNEIANYSYVIDSSPLTTSSSTQPTLTPTASPAPSQFPVLPIVVVVVIVVVAVAALMLLRKRQKLPPPPPPPPPPPMSEERSIF